jgi:pimeloyl-ACP methyl ester carboxylesterase
LQQTIFLQWRDDKDPEEAVLESNEYLRHFFFALLLTSPFYHNMKLLKSFLSLIFLLTLVSAVSADEPQTTAVLVHGAFADGSSWSRISPILEAKGLKVVAVQNPLSSLADDVAVMRRAIDQQTGPVVLVGHSWAGVVITEAANDPKVKALVYVAAFAPDNGAIY